MRVNKLLNYKLLNNHNVSIVTDNSKECVENSIFVLHKLNNVYLNEAIKKGAKTVITSFDIKLKEGINLYIVENTYKVLADILYKLNKRILKHYSFIGVTGTNGKTTTTTLIYRYLRSLEYNVILFGSNGIYMDDLCFENVNTTPSISKIYAFIVANYKNNKLIKRKFNKNFVIIECSSQGIRNNRIKNISFDVVGFTNITRDHLDYHKNISDYVFSKGLIFNNLKITGKVLMNYEDEHRELLANICPTQPIYYGIKGKYSYIIKERKFQNNHYIVDDSESVFEITSDLIGDFQIKNILLAYGIIKELNISIENFIEFVRTTDAIPGRINYFTVQNKHFIVDYAHTSSAVKTIIDFVKDWNFKNIIVVIGFGGNREKEKRFEMGKFLTESCSFVIFTEDNNRNESFEEIMNDVQTDIIKSNYVIIRNRFNAIKFAVEQMENNSLLLVLGKGIEKSYINDQYLNDEMMIKKVIYD